MKLAKPVCLRHEREGRRWKVLWQASIVLQAKLFHVKYSSTKQQLGAAEQRSDHDHSKFRLLLFSK